jgi:hypothetical protein
VPNLLINVYHRYVCIEKKFCTGINTIQDVRHPLEDGGGGGITVFTMAYKK